MHLNPVRARLIGPEDRWQEVDVRQRRKSDPEKLRIAARLRRETTLTIGWIAARLRLGTRESATTRPREYKAEEPAGTW